MWPNSALTSRYHQSLAASGSIRNFQLENARSLKTLAAKRRREEAERKIAEQRKTRPKPLKATKAYESVSSKVITSSRRQRHDDNATRRQESSKTSSQFLRGHAKSGPFVGRDPSPSSGTPSLRRSRSLVHVSPLDLDRLTETDDDGDDGDDLREEHPVFEPRFSEISPGRRRARIAEMLRDICNTTPLVESSLGRRSVTPSASVTGRPARTGRCSRTSRASTLVAEKSVQTDGVPALAGLPATPLAVAASKSRRKSASMSRLHKKTSGGYFGATDSNHEIARESASMKRRTTTNREYGNKENVVTEQGGQLTEAPPKVTPRSLAGELPPQKLIQTTPQLQARSDDGDPESISQVSKALTQDLILSNEDLEIENKHNGEEDGMPRVELPAVVKGISVDYVSANRDSASITGKRRLREKDEKKHTNVNAVNHRHRAGAVPRYLRKRQEEWRNIEAEKVAAAKAVAEGGCPPPGHVALSEDERLAALKALNDRYAELLTESNAIPVSSDTLRVKTRRKQVELELNELDEAIKTYSRPKVYVINKDIADSW